MNNKNKEKWRYSKSIERCQRLACNFDFHNWKETKN